DRSYSTVLEDREGRIIGVTVADDEQFRFPAVERLPDKYIVALIHFEDKNFPYHKGIDILAIGRAFYQNIKQKKVVSGGSTITMQVVRLSRNNPARTIREKLWEILLAIRIENSYTKEEILKIYASHAPFGGNIVGMQAAALKYFNRPTNELSWAEAALLAVLLNAPSLRDREVLKSKRDKLLNRLCQVGYINQEDLILAKAEPIPERAYETESIAAHLLTQAIISGKGERNKSYLDSRLQQQVNEIVKRHSRNLSGNLIYNAAVMVAHIPSGEVRAYVGNSPALPGSRGNDVDIITAVRSSGSVLKPALYALMIQNGNILPKSLVSDIPSRFGSYSPSNFNKTFLGVAPADKALSMSLNIPFVRMLRQYDYHLFHSDLKELGITTLNRPADDYGLSLILGGGETSLWDLCNHYGGMVSVLRHYNENDGDYFSGEYNRLKIWKNGDYLSDNRVSIEGQNKIQSYEAPLKAAPVWHTIRALREVERPDMESGWKKFASGINLAWKTGTSFGFRDAWAIGVNADWVIGVWIGNADGEGRPGLVGVRTAAPVLFEVVRLLPVEGRLYEPIDEMKEVVICRQSGYMASQICPDTDTLNVYEVGAKTQNCPYHRLVNLDKTGKWRVTSECEEIKNIQVKPWFVLSPVQEWYYARAYSHYKRLPPYRADCVPTGEDVMEMIYPQRGMRVFIPRDFGGQKGRVIFELAHRIPNAEVFWHIDNQYVATTKSIHQIEVDIEEGLHRFTLMDNYGNSLTQGFRVVGK
ncbi:MAG: penicillin-binding protein 1C, partial [Odoribacter sp.]|nr:penicillin-binding protein 1C [Odoribacter sp.]